MSVGLKKAKEKAKRCLPEDYYPSDKEMEAYRYCVRNGIIISPVATEEWGEVGKWNIGISTPDNYKKIYRSPEKCDKHSVTEVFYKYCIYYYEKSI